MNVVIYFALPHCIISEADILNKLDITDGTGVPNVIVASSSEMKQNPCNSHHCLILQACKPKRRLGLGTVFFFCFFRDGREGW